MKMVLSVLIALLTPSALHADTISLRADLWCPYNCAPNADKPGFMVEIANYAFSKAGHKVDYAVLNWSRAILEARNGQYEGIVGASPGDAPDFIYPEQEQGVFQSCFYTKSERQWAYDGIGSLASLALGVIKDYSYSDTRVNTYIKTYGNDAKRVQINSGDEALEKNFQKLLLGRVDAIVEDRAVMGYFLRGTAQGHLVKQAGCLERANVYIAFSPAKPRAREYAQILSEGLSELRATGKLKTILDSYGISDWQ